MEHEQKNIYRNGLFAKAGDVVTRENGEFVCRIARALCIGGTVSSKDFVGFRDEKAVARYGEEIPLDKPGERWIAPTGFMQFAIHIDGVGWVPRKPKDISPQAS